ncbi:hypothetical protein JKF63_06444 [Porcisia hertigi]|uniref:J domain-containing protein n=1 Tax=Porcisia hertigi TaxID=2761500 RepID=A0A836LJX9_9TRYP|nr:hypothetical protein JKF63_06444 [Porcisia hertigi]
MPMTFMCSFQVLGIARVIRSSGVSRSAVTTRCAYRSVSSGSSQQQQHCIAADEVRAALRTLGLAEDSTDAEVKKAFQVFAKQHHPDANAAAAAEASLGSERLSDNRGSEADASSRMRLGTEAYQLLRKVPYEVRQRILREEGCGGGPGVVQSRFCGPHDTSFSFTEEEYAKVQRIYQGDHHRRRRRRRSGRDVADRDDSDAGGYFDTRTEDGRRRTARLNEFQARIMEMRRRGIRDDLPPWRVYASEKGAGAAGDANFGSTSGDRANDGHLKHSGTYTTGTAPRNNPLRLGLHFFNATTTTTASLKGVRDVYRSRPTFAGMDGSSYDNPGSAARAAPEISANPRLHQYILMNHRAEEQAIVDRGTRLPLLFFVFLVCLSVVVMAAAAQSHRARIQKDVELRRRDELRGGA